MPLPCACRRVGKALATRTLVAERKKPVAVWGALFANVAIAVTKFVVAAISGSSAMLSEGIHSTIDTGNEVLLLIGEHRGARPPTAAHPFGHGKEVYFFTLLVAVLLFGIGGGMSVYEGITHFGHPRWIADPKWNLIVLAAAAVFEGTSWWIGRRELLRGRHDGVVSALRATKDAASMSVVSEDTAALIGLAIAAAGVLLNHFARVLVADAAASLCIGVLLCGVASFLAWQTRALLVGEAASPEVVAKIREVTDRDEGVRSVVRVLTMHLGPQQILLDLEVELEPDLDGKGIPQVISRLDAAIRRAVPAAHPIFIEAQPLADPRRSDATTMERCPTNAP